MDFSQTADDSHWSSIMNECKTKTLPVPSPMVLLPFEVMEQIIEEILLTIKGGQYLLSGRHHYRDQKSLVNWSIRNETLLGNRFKRTYKLHRSGKVVLKKVADINVQFREGVKDYLLHPLTITNLKEIPHVSEHSAVQQVEVLLLDRFQQKAWSRLSRFLEQSKATLHTIILDIAPPTDSTTSVIVPTSLWGSIFKAKAIKRFAFRTHDRNKPAAVNSCLLKRIMSEWKKMGDLEIHYFQGTANSRMGGMVYHDAKPGCSLTSLFLRNPMDLHKRDVEFLLSRSYRTLRELTIVLHQPKETDLQALVEGFKKCDSIKTLRVAIYQPLQLIFWDDTDEEDLDERNYPIGLAAESKQQDFVADIVKNFPALENLELAGDLWNNKIFTNFPTSVKLRSLSLKNVCDCDFGFLNECLSKSVNMVKLQELKVSNCIDVERGIEIYKQTAAICQQQKTKFNYEISKDELRNCLGNQDNGPRV
ncbi:hypothetical protein CROQUDRAFT_725347 [Cronartium quercuum f. sp. fusiforme G11]|uniref:Uncharacterized protein n=1 Tax=Cronartium quercuum f. sp. fusiforme G11 TaxID=708437 RepID=A0A9P6T7F7_9BASI|nr:hypothetical protein CROQUDRAFT_725347 [Cronartium quercuum f. sp. fusiforme G11]